MTTSYPIDDKNYLLFQKIFHDLLSNQMRTAPSPSKTFSKDEASSSAQPRRVRKAYRNSQQSDRESEVDCFNNTESSPEDVQYIRSRHRPQRTESNVTLTRTPSLPFKTSAEETRVYKGLCIEHRSDSSTHDMPMFNSRMHDFSKLLGSNAKAQEHKPPSGRQTYNANHYNKEPGKYHRRSYSQGPVDFADAIANKQHRPIFRDSSKDSLTHKRSKGQYEQQQRTYARPVPKQKPKPTPDVDMKMKFLGDIWQHKLMTTKKVLEGILLCLQNDKNYNETTMDDLDEPAEEPTKRLPAKQTAEKLQGSSKTAAASTSVASETVEKVQKSSEVSKTQPSANVHSAPKGPVPAKTAPAVKQQAAAEAPKHDRQSKYSDKPPEGADTISLKQPKMQPKKIRFMPKLDAADDLPTDSKLKLYNAAVDKWESLSQANRAMESKCFSLKRKYATTELNPKPSRKQRRLRPQVKAYSLPKSIEKLLKKRVLPHIDTNTAGELLAIFRN